MNHPVLFYDGTCPLCHRAVLFFLKVDRNEVLRYSALQSEFAKKSMGDRYEKFMERDTVILMKEDEFYFESEAVVEGLKLIDGYRWLGSVINIFPSFLSNTVYRWIAGVRKKVFKTCPIIPPRYRHLFID